MGRLTTVYADRPVLDRSPWVLYGELAIGSASQPIEYPPATFSCQTDKPVEIHRMIPRLTALDESGVALPTQPSQDLLASLVKISFTMFNLEQKITRVPTPIINLTKGEAERTWEFAEPALCERSTGITVSIETRTFPLIADLSTILVGISFEGFLLVIAPPTNNR